jgi:hypothetical protein
MTTPEKLSELIVDLSLRNLALEKKAKELEAARDSNWNEYTLYKNYLEEIATIVVGHSSMHPHSVVGVIREKLGKKEKKVQ